VPVECKIVKQELEREFGYGSLHADGSQVALLPTANLQAGKYMYKVFAPAGGHLASSSDNMQLACNQQSI
jgi:hypothetical protein